jgi:hypothetical protein
MVAATSPWGSLCIIAMSVINQLTICHVRWSYYLIFLLTVMLSYPSYCWMKVLPCCWRSRRRAHQLAKRWSICTDQRNMRHIADKYQNSTFDKNSKQSNRYYNGISKQRINLDVVVRKNWQNSAVSPHWNLSVVPVLLPQIVQSKLSKFPTSSTNVTSNSSSNTVNMFSPSMAHGSNTAVPDTGAVATILPLTNNSDSLQACISRIQW